MPTNGRLRFVDLDRTADLGPPPSPTEVVVGLSRQPLEGSRLAAAAAFDLTLTSAPVAARHEVAVPDVAQAAARLEDAVAQNPGAALVLCGLLRMGQSLSFGDGLVAESLAYSMLLAGQGFADWRSAHPRRPIPAPVEPEVLLEREGNTLTITLNRPERRNAFGVGVRDGLVDGLDLAALDSTIDAVVLQGNGVAFCSGGDLDEFGSSADVALAHWIRLDRSAARRIDAVANRVRVHLHGACIGAGIELASFAHVVVAAADTVIELPELAMGLIPGAGGTVGISRRIGRWRTAYLALSGDRIGAAKALEWGLVDALG